MESLRRLMPKLTMQLRKGDMGKIAIIGGSVEYTGAPYYAAATVVNMGADLIYVMCSPEAAPIIKGYSPDFIVHPSLEPEFVIPDGLWFLSENITMLPRLESAILTPNFMEFSRLCKAALGVDDVVKIRDPEEIRKLAVRLSDKIGVAVFVKKEHDILVDPEGDVTESEAIGSPRRVGGQGDTTAGSLGLLLYWARKTGLDWKSARKEASMASSWLIRESARRAFAAEGRPMTTTHVIGQIANVIRMVDNK